MPSFPSPRKLPFYILSLWFWLLICHISRIMLYLSFCDWLNKIFSRFIHIVVYVRISFIFKAEEYPIVCIYNTFAFPFIHQLHLSIWLISLSMINSNPSMLLQMVLFHSFFYGWVIFHCVYVPHILYPVICPWVFRFFPCLGYYRYHCYEHCGAYIFLN